MSGPLTPAEGSFDEEGRYIPSEAERERLRLCFDENEANNQEDRVYLPVLMHIGCPDPGPNPILNRRCEKFFVDQRRPIIDEPEGPVT